MLKLIDRNWQRVVSRLTRASAVYALILSAGIANAAIDTTSLESIAERAGALARTHSFLVAIDGKTVVARGYRGHDVDATANIKSLSKTLIATLVGAAIDRGVIENVDQPIGELLGSRMPQNADARVAEITVGQLLSM